MGFSMFGLFDTFFPFLFGTIFLLVIGMFFFVIIRGIGQWNHNNHSPRLSVPAKVVSRRQHHEHHAAANSGTGMGSTSYYVTFEVESGDRMEFHLTGKEYGMLAEGDEGMLTFQGTRYHGFERNRSSRAGF
jgi:hypothetical protein